uniref:Glycoside hydrolase family 31 N-terminal domain-containing protein n=1 Tax=Arion vulgaris TaxID=1028688 RepID=A0A0B7BC39_9EUPU
MDNRDRITIERSSLLRLAYMVPLCSCFLYFSKLMLFGSSTIWLPGVTVTEDLVITFSDSQGQPYLTGHSDFTKREGLLLDYCRHQQNNARTGCLEDPNNQLIKIMTDSTDREDVTCYQVRREGLRCVSQVVMDCYSFGNSHWYGGFQSVNQMWPLKKAVPIGDGLKREVESDGVELVFGPYVSADSGVHKLELSSVLERLFISSSGVGMMVSQDSPLYLSFNQHKDGQICLAAVYDGSHYVSPYNKPPVLEYTVCKANNVREIHTYMTDRFIQKPEATPNIDLFKRPIWSTWAHYNRDINQSRVLEFADQILSHKLPACQLEIDDAWTSHYGDLEFDRVKFPDAQKMVADLNKKGFPVTLWIHPFISLKSDNFHEAFQNKFVVMMKGCEIPALTRWWNEDMAAILDVTNPAAVLWYQKKLEHLQQVFNISSFKFDGGEAQFVPDSHRSFQQMTSTNFYASLWAELAANTDSISRRQEVRIGSGTQRLPVFVRLMDRMSSWDRQAGLLSVIPAVLTFGIIGYPFVLPDMIGGNAYVDTVTFQGGAYPERELYIRWLQLNTFLPALQFSVAPWIYDAEVVALTKKFLALREHYIPVILELAEESVHTGDPLIRPLWWNSPLDENALIIEDQFLLGDGILVAPVVVKGARKRDIYLPEGAWTDKLKGDIIQGPTYLTDYLVALDELAFFEKVK